MCGPVVQIITSCSGSCTGSRRSINWSTRVKMAVFAPMPNASEATATTVKSGLLRRLRRANLKSEKNRDISVYTVGPQKGYAGIELK